MEIQKAVAVFFLLIFGTPLALILFAFVSAKANSLLNPSMTRSVAPVPATSSRLKHHRKVLMSRIQKLYAEPLHLVLAWADQEKSSTANTFDEHFSSYFGSWRASSPLFIRSDNVVRQHLVEQTADGLAELDELEIKKLLQLLDLKVRHMAVQQL